MHWNGGTDWGGEVGVSILQDRLGLSLGYRRLSGFPDLFVALNVSDLNGMVYWLTPWAERKKLDLSNPASDTLSTKSSCCLSEAATGLVRGRYRPEERRVSVRARPDAECPR